MLLDWARSQIVNLGDLVAVERDLRDQQETQRSPAQAVRSLAQRIRRNACEVSMSDIQRLDSPDQRFYFLLVSNELRMSHWVTSAALWERDPPRLLLQIGDDLWSSEQIAWSADSGVVSVGLRRYPGDVPGIMIDIYPERQLVIPHPPADPQPLPFAALNTFLERYYEQHRRMSS